MNLQVQKPPASRPLIILFLIIMLSVCIVGVAYYNHEKDNLLSQKLQELSAISDLKIRQITQWRFERLADARFLGENIMSGYKISEFLENKKNSSTDLLLKHLLKSLEECYDYRSAAIIDTKGEVRLAFPERDSSLYDNLQPILPEVLKSQKVFLTDMERNNSSGYAHLDLIVPLFDRSISDTLVQGFIVLDIDPAKGLYPILSSWPSASKSAETFIVRKRGEDIIYLSELRHMASAEAKSRKPASDNKLPAAMAFRGIKGTIDGVDYRNVRVVASMKKIPGTTWFMIAKIDRDEVFSVLESQMRLILTALILFIVTIGLFLGFILWNQTVTFYRSKYEEELNRQALFKHFDYILKFANDIIFLLDKELNIVEANERTIETYMFGREEVIGLNIEKIQAKDTLDRLYENIVLVHDTGSATFETVHLRKDGTLFPVEVSCRLVDIEGETYYQVIGRNITDRKSAEATLKESELRFRKIFEESPFPMVITGKDFGIIRANASFCRMTGYDEEELKLHSLSELEYPDDATDDHLNLMRLVAEDIPLYHAEKRYIRKDRSIILGSSTISIVRNERDEAQLFIGMIEDITQKKKDEQELIAAKLKAEESDRLKTAFLHNVSHEIRTPMNAIIGFTSLLHEPDLKDPDRQQYTEIIFQSSNQLLSIINDIVDVANIESGQVKVNASRTDINLALRNLSEQFTFGGKQNKIPILLTTGLPDGEAVITTDSTKLIQIISNLINNSIKFTKRGRIDFGYELKDHLLEFYVKDTGIGIPKDSIPKIFDRFYQVDRTVSRQFGGTGLGLSICKAYVHLLGGEISVTSDPGKGTNFIFTIPYIPTQ
jgi:PAS domain S-box-containing protein